MRTVKVAHSADNVLVLNDGGPELCHGSARLSVKVSLYEGLVQWQNDCLQNSRRWFDSSRLRLGCQVKKS